MAESDETEVVEGEVEGPPVVIEHGQQVSIKPTINELVGGAAVPGGPVNRCG